MLCPEKPIVARLHGLEVYDPFLKQVNWSRIDLILSPAQKLRFDALVTSNLKYWAPKSQTVLPIGVDTSPTSKPREAFGHNIGFVAVTSLPRKRVYTTIETFYDLCKESKQKWTLNIRTSMKPTGFRNAESHEYRNFYGELISEMADMNLTDKSDTKCGNIIFHDYSTPEAYRQWLSGMDVFWCNSMQEGYSKSTMEAASYGAYPLVHRWRGASLTFAPENLFLSQRELVDKTIAWDNVSEETKRKISLASQRIIAANHDEAVVAKKIVDLIMAAGSNYTRD
jgi:glycosyltransferase involved in cell wall biosynthesis